MSEREPAAAEAESLADVADSLEMEPEELQDVLSGVERTLNDLTGLDVDVNDVEDLDRVRDHLPTEPQRAKIIQAALPAPLRNALEYVSPSERQSGYWRRARERRDLSELSDEEVVQRHEFVQAATDVRGLEGTVRTEDGREIPRSAAVMGDDLEGEDFDVDAEEDRRDKGLSILNRMREWI